MGSAISSVAKDVYSLHDLQDTEIHGNKVGSWFAKEIQGQLYGSNQQLDQQEQQKSIQAQITKHNAMTKMLTDQNSGFNSRLSASISLTDANARYGSQSGIGGTVRPSDLMAIRDPQTKMAKSTARGGSLRQFNIASNQDDAGSANTISGAGSGGMSNNINSAGGSGITNSVAQNGMNQRQNQSVMVSS